MMKLIWLILPAAITLTSCGELIGFSSLSEPDLGNITKVKLYLNDENLRKLFDSVSESDFVPCIYEEDGAKTAALIRVRGLSSRTLPKKSFTVKIASGNAEIRYALERLRKNWIQNRLAMFTYGKVGLWAENDPVIGTKAVGVFLNDEYIGAYNRLDLYAEVSLENTYQGVDGELFAAFYSDMGSDTPLQHRSEKKFPNDADFTSLNTLIANAINMGDAEWATWVLRNVSTERIAQYMVAHDFLAVDDTETTNFYIYNNGRIFMLPWDNERSMRLGGGTIGGDNLLTQRLMEVGEIRTFYKAKMDEFFINPGPTNIVGLLRFVARRMVDEVDKALKADPTFSLDYNEAETRSDIVNFLSNRAAEVQLSSFYLSL